MQGKSRTKIGCVRRTALLLLAAAALAGRSSPVAAQDSRTFTLLEVPIFTFLQAEQHEYRIGGSSNEPAAAFQAERPIFTFFQTEENEYRTGGGRATYSWEAQGWVGGDYNRIWFKTQGDDIIGGKVEDAELQLLYSRAITAFLNLQMGARYDPAPTPTRGFAVFTIEGLAPYWVETNASLFVSHKGDVSARLEAEYDVLLTQRLIARPLVKLDFAAQNVEDVAIGSGLSSVELGLRLRYEIRREFAPYIGVAWERKVGRTADLTRREGEDVNNVTLILGIRFWF
jgi:copper resistance protein B